MDSGQLTTARKLLLMSTKLEAFLKPWFPNTAAHRNHLGSSKNMTSHPTPQSRLISLTSLLCGMNREVGLKKKNVLQVIQLCSKGWEPLSSWKGCVCVGEMGCTIIIFVVMASCCVGSFSFNFFLKITQPKSKQTVKTEKFWKIGQCSFPSLS